MKTIRFLIAATLLAGAAEAAFDITPFLSCVDVDQTAGEITAYFGYESREAAIQQVIVGADNRFVPAPAFRGQPVLFFPGLHERAFRIKVALTGTLWLFNGFGVPAQTTSKPCTAPAQAAPLSLPLAAAFTPYAQKLVAVGGKAQLTWQATTQLPPGLLLSTDGLLSGTPSAAGVHTLGFQASDGFTATSVTYQLTIAPGLRISDALSTRPPGFAPQFRTVTQVGATNSAVASCGIDEFVITGGGGCVVPNQNTIQGRIASSQMSANGWAVACSGGIATAVAVCSLK